MPESGQACTHSACYVQEHSTEAAEAEDEEVDGEEGTPRGSGDGTVALDNRAASELAKFASQKEHKRSMETGIDLFNRSGACFLPRLLIHTTALHQSH